MELRRMMSVRWEKYLWKEPHPVSPREFEELERQWQVRLPEEYKRLVATCQGMTPEPAFFYVGGTSNVFNALLTISQVPGREEYSVMRVYQTLAPYVPPGIYPFAMTPGAEYLCFDYRNSVDEPKVILVTMETFIYPVAESFQELLAGLHEE